MDKTTWLIALTRAGLAASLFVVVFIAARIRFAKGAADDERSTESRMD
ncbi:hypothetical protein PZ938_01065 [Luteipulveratus sp. YIM 133132]|uniref:Uncharacterized protein n=1 Tax=Luteipulveratus flavus TaxID=3031728 RepID=A0ABT6C7N8_9MICO|nr:MULTISPECIES: hypothetical protein [unclassified Luteipulveratus]MDE9364185.1 hypothetical protein [Luteipulveratus sp. YIM 133132]MDF8264946.1 hypothetical protein [Luteipulveratus sp. YIM 133296]